MKKKSGGAKPMGKGGSKGSGFVVGPATQTKTMCKGK